MSELFILLVLVAVAYLYMQMAAKGKTWFIRRVRGVDEIDAALARATELGGGVHFSPGDQADLKGEYLPQTIAGFECLQYVAKYCARTKTPLVVTLCGRGGSGGDLVPVTSNIVREAYKTGGWPEGYVEGDTVRYASGEMYMYTMAMQGIYRRENIKANFLIGPWAGSMLQATGLAAGFGITQVSGTARLWQMPTEACMAKYFMVGEEMFAAGALLSGDKNVLSTLRVEDLAKIALLAGLIIGVALYQFGSQFIAQVLNY